MYEPVRTVPKSAGPEPDDAQPVVAERRAATAIQTNGRNSEYFMAVARAGRTFPNAQTPRKSTQQLEVLHRRT
jgi:hypothetical protein